MQIIMLSGGSGMRLWPLSNSVRSKQFLQLLKAPDGRLESMVQRVFRQLKESGVNAPVTMATGAAQADALRAQVGDGASLVLEPERRNTYPAIALACAYLRDQKQVPDDETVVVLPVDPFTETSYFRTLPELDRAVQQNAADLVLMGIAPTGPSEKYGYIVPAKAPSGAPWTRAERFTEKPGRAEAEALIARGAVWNAGVFAFRLGWLWKAVSLRFSVTGYADLRERYGRLPKTSFDFETVENTRSIALVPYRGVWKDLGTWDAMTEEMENSRIGPCVVGEEVTGTHVINELGIPIVVLGVDHLVIAASPDGILVSDKSRCAALKTYVEPLAGEPMVAPRPWGEATVLETARYASGRASRSLRLKITAGKQLGPQKHRERDLSWTVLDGEGRLWLDGRPLPLRGGDTAFIPRNTPYALLAATDMQLLEVQLGAELTDGDTQPVPPDGQA